MTRAVHWIRSASLLLHVLASSVVAAGVGHLKCSQDGPPHKLRPLLMIGAQKCGTTYLSGLLNEHKGISGARGMKEVRFDRFVYGWKSDIADAEELSWWNAYLSCFPRAERQDAVYFLDATPVYMPAPQTPRAVFDRIPDAKLLITLKSAALRYFSEWAMETRRQEHREEADFPTVDEIRAEIKSFMTYVHGEDVNHTHRHEQIKWENISYEMAITPIARGMYLPQLKSWLHYFPSESFHIISNDQLIANKEATLQGIYDFLGLEWSGDFHEVRGNHFEVAVLNPVDMNESIAVLQRFYEPVEQALFAFLKERGHHEFKGW